MEAAPVEAAPVEAAPAEVPAENPPAAASAEAAPDATAAEAPPAPAEAKKPGKKERVEEVESEAVKAALDAAVEKATGVTGDRLARLRDAVKVVGGRVKDVRLVRVFGVEEPVQGATTLGSFQYVVDLSPSNMSQSFSRPEKRGGRGGPGGGRGGGSGGKGAAATGGFSMDSLRDDRKGQRPGGGGRKPGGGGGPRGK